MTRTYPDTFDNDDITLVDAITPDNVFVEELVVVVSWMDGAGEHNWKAYACGSESIATALGLLELAKVDLITRAGNEEEEDDET